MTRVYTIGHSTLPLDQFIEHLKRYGVTLPPPDRLREERG